jgi:hypothetical protein
MFHELNITAAAVTISPQLEEMLKYTSSSSRRKSNNVKQTTISTGGTSTTATTSQQLLQQITKSDHAPGIRRAGCPCCDPDAASNYADKMMMGGLT